MDGVEERFLTRNGRAARRLAELLLDQEVDTRLPRIRDWAGQLGCGNGTVQAALRLLEETGAVETVARGHLGTFLVRADRALLWRLAGLGTMLTAMPLPYSRRYEGLATGLRTAFEEAGVPVALTFMRGAASRVQALVEGKVDLIVLSRLAADELTTQEPITLAADLGSATYVGSHGLLRRRGVPPDAIRLRVAVDNASHDQRALAERAFAEREVTWVEVPYTQLPELLRRGEVDATVWNLDEVHERIGEVVDVLPLGDEITRDLSLRNSSAALAVRSSSGGALSAVRHRINLDTVTDVQRSVLRGERLPSY